MIAEQSSSTRPYLVRALHEWCTDNGYTPYVAVLVDNSVHVPRDYVKDGEIVLNISFDATQGLELSNECIRFKARFGGVARDIFVPMDRVVAIYARENGQGMAFPQPVREIINTAPDASTDEGATPSTQAPALRASPSVVPLSAVKRDTTMSSQADADDPPRPPSGPRPSLKRVK